MIKLYGFGEKLSMVDPSPFVLKVDVYLRMVGLEFESHAQLSNVGKAPKKKLPYIDDKGTIVADSYFIIRYLQQTYGDSLDQALTKEQQAIGHLVTRSLEENLYFCAVHFRWVDPECWPDVEQSFFSFLPRPLRYFIAKRVRRKMKRTLYKQGIGRHSRQDILLLAEHSLQSLSDLLADKRYLFGEQLSSYDACFYAFLAELILVDLDGELNKKARSYTNLVDYCQRIQQQFY